MTKLIKQGTYPLTVYDNEISDELADEVFNFLLDSEYCINFYDPPHSLWYPRKNTLVTPRNLPGTLRCPLAWDAGSLKHRAPPVYKLWEQIVKITDNKFTLEGVPEGMNYNQGISPLSTIPKPDGTPGTPNSAWRVYGDGLDHEFRARTKTIHRDSSLVDDDTNFTLVYFANRVWHPQFYAETLFHSNDSDTGDFTGKFDSDQKRNYPIGDIENVVAPRPKRFMIFDSRYLHQLKPCAHFTPEKTMAIVFRIKSI
jgi:hypothetical protein